MNQKIKYQYTYFIYPYVVSEKKFDKYILKLLNNKNCKLKIMEREKDMDLYTYFLPKIRSTLFWTMDMSKRQIDKLNKIDKSMKSVLLKEYPCTIFEYDIKKDIPGKVGKQDGIFFNISKIEIVCFNTGICFLLLKTMLDDGSSFSDLLNFNYKFRDIKSSVSELKNYDNIKIQIGNFDDIKNLMDIVKEITGTNKAAKDLNLENERFITYSYVCLGQENWNDKESMEILQKEFYKFASFQQADYKADYESLINGNMKLFEKSKYEIYAFNKIGTVLLTSDINTENYTTLPHHYERAYLYNYILELYKKINLNKVNSEFRQVNRFVNAQDNFIDFTQKLWIEEATTDNTGTILSKIWNQILSTEETYAKIKIKYDTLYKNSNIDKTQKMTSWILAILMILLIIKVLSILLNGGL